MYRRRRPPGIENLIETIEKLSIDPAYKTNWCHMPAEIKLKCIGKMEFEERLSLRSTAKAERSLVDSQKIELNEGYLCLNDKFLAFVLHHNKKPVFTKNSKDKIEGYELIKYIKKIVVFEKLSINFKTPLANYEQFMTDDELFTAKEIVFEFRNIGNVIPALRKLKNGVESIKMGVDGIEFSNLDEILAVSHIQNVPYWHILEYEQTDSLCKVAQMWIDKNSKIGSTFQVSVFPNDSFEEFVELFDDRISSKSGRRVRIRTNNPDRHILLERGLDDYVRLDWSRQFFRLMVISAEMKDSEYDDNCKEWICEMDPGMHGAYDVDGYDDYDAFYYFAVYGHLGF